MSEKLASSQAHIWYVRPETVIRKRLLSRYERLLTPEERARKLRFRFEESRLDTKGLIACLVARDCDVGVDVENATRSVGFLEIADRYFSPHEVADIRSLPDSSRRKRFFEYWTLKESIIKAMGTQIASGLSRFSFDLRTDVIRATFDPSVPGEPTGWQFLLREIGPEHVLAASLRTENGQPLQIEVRETVPLAS